MGLGLSSDLSGICEQVVSPDKFLSLVVEVGLFWVVVVSDRRMRWIACSGLVPYNQGSDGPDPFLEPYSCVGTIDKGRLERAPSCF